MTHNMAQNSADNLPTSKQVCQQACKMQIPPYGLKQRRRPQFRMPRRASLQVFFPGEICIGRCPNFSFFPGAMCIYACEGAPLGQSSPKWEKTCYAPIPVIVPNFIAVGQTVYDKSVTKNLLRQSKRSIPTILPYCGIISFKQKVNDHKAP